jgi:catechol-2,3-dioxygenase
MTPSLERVDHIHVYVADRKAAEQWYLDVLGFASVPELESWAGSGPLTIGNASGSVHLALFERPVKECRSTVAFAATATEFLAWRAHLAGKLGRPVDAVDHQVAWSLYFADPDGNPFEITSYEYAAVSGGF